MAKNITKLKHRFPLRQLRYLTKFISLRWPILVLISLTLVIGFLNYEANTYLTGWDNLHTEFNPLLDLKRGIFSVWQEYRGLGLLSGMAHAADIPRTLIVYALSFLLPTNLIRYVLTFSTLAIGSLGVFYFLDNILLKNHLDSRTTQTASLLGAVFYILNLSTLQTYFIPFETFTWFFAFFPWIFSLFIRYLSQPSLRQLLLVFIVLLLSSPAFFVETTFIVLLLCLFPIFVEHFHSYKDKLKSTTQSLTLFIVTIVSQSFWLLPIIFYVFTQAHSVELARNNLISSPETYERNLQYANPIDVALLKGYLFSYLDLSTNNQYDYILSLWKQHLSSPVISIIGFIIFAITATGFYYLVKKQYRWSSSVIGLSLFSLFFLLGGGLIINQTIPFVGELFRSPFTKFSIPLSFCYSILFAVGTIFLLDLFSFLHNRLTNITTIFTVTLFLFLYMSPIFSGNLISPSLRREIPSEYSQIFEFFSSQDPSGRIATFPQYTHWNWSYYDWGYRGSGFLWYGLPQALLDRSFDVWSPTSENYYQEISSAIYSEDWELFDRLITKYNINWLLLDYHITTPENQISLKTQALSSHLQNHPDYTLAKNFNNSLSIYSTKAGPRVKNFVSTSPLPTLTNPFTLTDLRPNTSPTITSDAIIYPSITTTNSNGYLLNLPSITDLETLIPVNISYQKAYGTLSLKIQPQIPSITLNNQSLGSTPAPTYVHIPVTNTGESLILQINQDFFELQLPAEVTEFIGFYPIAGAYLPSKTPITINLYDGNPSSNINVTPAIAQSTPYQCFTSKPNRKIEKIINGDTISLFGTDVVGCLSTPLPPIFVSGVYSVDFSYYSPTLTTGNISITNLNLGSINTTQPLEATTNPLHTRIFAQTDNQPQKLNLILEANETKSIQEINYSKINLYFHPLLFSVRTSLVPIPATNIVLKNNTNTLSLSIPIIDSVLDTVQTPTNNQLLPESRNCDQFNSGPVSKKITANGILYENQNSIGCDYLNLRHFPHSLNYLVSINYRHRQGLTPTVCLENHSTRRCDINERLAITDKAQTLLQPIRNDREDPGFTLHLLNQSIGTRKTINIIKEISLHPLPLHYLQNISLTSPDHLYPIREKAPADNFEVTHPAEFLYTVSNAQNTDQLINLYQSRSPFWIALSVPSSTLRLSPLQLTFAIPFLYLSQQSLLPYDAPNTWYNSWLFSPQDTSIIIFYAPQYLEFIGFILIALLLIFFSFYYFSSLPQAIKNRLTKKAKR